MINLLTKEQYYTHQVLELPEHHVDVIHFKLFRGVCPRFRCCKRMNKALVPMDNRTGYGPRLSAMIAEMVGTQADSLRIVQNFCASVWGFQTSLGAIQRVIDRAVQRLPEPLGASPTMTPSARLCAAKKSIMWTRRPGAKT
jgi:transposase